jgi:hypothetical protein
MLTPGLFSTGSTHANGAYTILLTAKMTTNCVLDTIFLEMEFSWITLVKLFVFSLWKRSHEGHDMFLTVLNFNICIQNINK